MEENNKDKDFRRQMVIVGVVNIVAGLFSLGLFMLHKYEILKNGNNFILSYTVILPLLIGFITGYILKKEGRDILFLSLYNTLAALLINGAVLQEGFICLLIISPLILGMILLGCLIGYYIANRGSNNLKISFGILIFSIVLVDFILPNNEELSVQDEVIINAPPEKVWEYIIEYPKNEEKSDYWLFQIGLPHPIQSRAAEHKVGAKRECVFAGDLVFEEKITKIVPNKELVFEVTKQPEHPEIMGHLDLKYGQFILEELPGGKTKLVGISGYYLYVRPTLYFDLWATSIIRNVHLKVMNNIKNLSEKG